MNPERLGAEDVRALPVAGLRRMAKSLTGAVGDRVAVVARCAASTVPNERCVAGYALAWLLPTAPEQAGRLATTLVRDDEWTVREAASFGVREATTKNYAAVAELLRSWAGEQASDREHRAFLVVSRQPGHQDAAVVEELLTLLAVPLADPAPYVRKNVPFALRYLARTHGDRLVPRLLRWARTGDRGLEGACLAVLAYGHANTASAHGELVDLLLRSEHPTVRRQAARIKQR